MGTAGRRSEFPTLFAGPSRPSSNGEHRRLRARGQRQVAVSRETSPATGLKKPSPRRAYPPSLWRRGSRIRAKSDARPGVGTSSAVDTSPLTLTHARASDGCGRRPPGPGVPASPGQRAIPLAAKGFYGNGCGDRIRADQRVTQMSRERDPARPRPRVLRIRVKRQLPSEPCGRSELSSRPPDRSYLPDNPRAPRTSQSPTRWRSDVSRETATRRRCSAAATRLRARPTTRPLSGDSRAPRVRSLPYLRRGEIDVSRETGDGGKPFEVAAAGPTPPG